MTTRAPLTRVARRSASRPPNSTPGIPPRMISAPTALVGLLLGHAGEAFVELGEPRADAGDGEHQRAHADERVPQRRDLPDGARSRRAARGPCRRRRHACRRRPASKRRAPGRARPTLVVDVVGAGDVQQVAVATRGLDAGRYARNATKMLGGPTTRNAARHPNASPIAPPSAMPRPKPMNTITCWFENTRPR